MTRYQEKASEQRNIISKAKNFLYHHCPQVMSNSSTILLR